jgi:hypothetical protein
VGAAGNSLVTPSPTEIWGGAAAPALPGFGGDARPPIPTMNGGTVRMRTFMGFWARISLTRRWVICTFRDPVASQDGLQSSSMVERAAVNREVAGSSPASGANFLQTRLMERILNMPPANTPIISQEFAGPPLL